jgi:hypothetical protein
MEGVVNHLSKQLKCSYCGQTNNEVDNCFSLYPKKCHYSERKKTLEAKIDTLDDIFNNLASFSQILDSPSSFELKASFSIPDYYIFSALGEV